MFRTLQSHIVPAYRVSCVPVARRTRVTRSLFAHHATVSRQAITYTLTRTLLARLLRCYSAIRSAPILLLLAHHLVSTGSFLSLAVDSRPGQIRDAARFAHEEDAQYEVYNPLGSGEFRCDARDVWGGEISELGRGPRDSVLDHEFHDRPVHRSQADDYPFHTRVLWGVTLRGGKGGRDLAEYFDFEVCPDLHRFRWSCDHIVVCNAR